jgi:seryl-tRNA synthetase
MLTTGALANYLTLKRMTMSYDPNDPTFKGLETGTFSSANSRCRGCGLPMLEHLGANCLTAWKRKAQKLERQRDEKAQWVTELQAKLAQALAVCNDDLSKMQALTASLAQMTAASQDADEDLTLAAKYRSQLMERVTALTAERDNLRASFAGLDKTFEQVCAERDAAQKALGIVWNVYSLRRSYGFTDEEQVIVDAALAQARV